MSKRSIIENKNPGSLDFIENSLNENSKDLRELKNEIHEICQSLKDFNELKAVILRLSNLLSQLMSQRGGETEPEKNSAVSDHKILSTNMEVAPISDYFVVKCANWADFETYAKGVQQVVFAIRESDRVFEADAVKGNQIIAYIGKVPEVSELLKVWLSTKLGSASAFEGAITKT
jgi:hypothetical protein